MTHSDGARQENQAPSPPLALPSCASIPATCPVSRPARDRKNQVMAHEQTRHSSAKDGHHIGSLGRPMACNSSPRMTGWNEDMPLTYCTAVPALPAPMAFPLTNAGADRTLFLHWRCRCIAKPSAFLWNWLEKGSEQSTLAAPVFDSVEPQKLRNSHPCPAVNCVCIRSIDHHEQAPDLHVAQKQDQESLSRRLGVINVQHATFAALFKIPHEERQGRLSSCLHQYPRKHRLRTGLGYCGPVDCDGTVAKNVPGKRTANISKRLVHRCVAVEMRLKHGASRIGIPANCCLDEARLASEPAIQCLFRRRGSPGNVGHRGVPVALLDEFGDGGI